MHIVKRRFGKHEVTCEIRDEEMSCESVNGKEEPVRTTDKEMIKRTLVMEIIALIRSMKPRRREEG